MDRASADTDRECACREDLQDVASVVRGDGDAFARLVARYQNAINAYMRHFTRNRATREDLVHDVFVEAYVSLRRFRGEGPFLHWLRIIATRVGYRHWRHNAREGLRREVPLEEHKEFSVTPDASPASRSKAEFLYALLGKLPPRDRLVLTLLYLEGVDGREAAKTLGWSYSMVRVQAYRARRKFGRILEQHNWRREHE